MLNSSRSSTHPRPSTRRSARRPALAVAAFTVALVAVAPVQPATATPIPFLDFLYPSFYTSPSPSPVPLSPPAASRARRPSRSKSLPVPAAPVPAAAGLNAQQQQTQKQRQQRRRSALAQAQPHPQLAKRDTTGGQKVPVKYESVDGGWVIADSWDLHGHHRRSDPSTASTPDSTPGIPVQNLDTTGNSVVDDPNSSDPYIVINTAEDSLDLPVGWQNSLSARHESYDPVIVAVFAVILVMSILGTIGLCRWRARKLRKLRDLEKLEKGAGESEADRGSNDGGDTTDSSEKKMNEKPKRKKSVGSSSALRKRFARFRRRHRAKNGASGNRQEAEEKTSDTSDEEEPRTTTPDDSSATTLSATSRPASVVQPDDREALSSAASTIIDDTSPISINDNPPNEPLTEPQIIVTAPGQPSPAPSPPPPTSSPPAYPLPPLDLLGSGAISAGRAVAENSPRTPLPPEKMPIRGLEAEYDDRDLQVYLAASSSATPRRSRVRFMDEVPPPSVSGQNREAADELAQDEETVPSFEPFASMVGGPSRVAAVAAGATRRAHVATDDKGLLERLRSLADEPVPHARGVGPSAPGSQDMEEAVVPPWAEVDEWDAERQMELVHAPDDPGLSNSILSHATRASRASTSSTSATASSTSSSGLPPARISTSPSPFPTLPPPPTTSGSSGIVTYDLGTVWSSMGIAPSDEARPVRVASAPPPLVPTLLPSAPPPPLDGDEAVIPSAPPDWDIEDDLEVEQLKDAANTTSTVPLEEATTHGAHDSEGNAHSAQDAHDAHDAHDSSAARRESTAPVPVPSARASGGSGEQDQEGDDDGAESIMSTPPDEGDSRSRWSATFRTRAEEGAGLPRYEP